MRYSKEELESQKRERLGEINYNTYGSKMTIIEYYGVRNIIVRFDNGFTIKTRYDSFKNGQIKSPYCKSVCGIGYFGVGNYKRYINGKVSRQYSTWRHMLMRCYDEKYYEKHFTYKDCTVCDEWHNYQVFYKWYNDNFYTVNSETMELDKDILHKGNKVYSPDTCVFVPQRINSLFVKNDENRGNFPIGVSWDNQKNKYLALCNNNNNKQIKLGRFNTFEEAFQIYKKYKENLIKEIADRYKGLIPQNLYETMYRYEVETSD